MENKPKIPEHIKANLQQLIQLQKNEAITYHCLPRLNDGANNAVYITGRDLLVKHLTDRKYSFVLLAELLLEHYPEIFHDINNID